MNLVEAVKAYFTKFAGNEKSRGTVVIGKQMAAAVELEQDGQERLWKLLSAYEQQLAG